MSFLILALITSAIALILTFVLTVHDIVDESNGCRLKACLNRNFPTYFVIRLLGNLATSLIALYFLWSQLPDLLVDFSFLFAPLIGCFLFEEVLANVDIKIAEWNAVPIKRTSENAKRRVVERALVKESEFLDQEAEQTAARLMELTDLEEVRTMIMTANEDHPGLHKSTKKKLKKYKPDNEHQFLCEEIAIHLPARAKERIALKKKSNAKQDLRAGDEYLLSYDSSDQQGPADPKSVRKK